MNGLNIFHRLQVLFNLRWSAYKSSQSLSDFFSKLSSITVYWFQQQSHQTGCELMSWPIFVYLIWNFTWMNTAMTMTKWPEVSMVSMPCFSAWPAHHYLQLIFCSCVSHSPTSSINSCFPCYRMLHHKTQTLQGMNQHHRHNDQCWSHGEFALTANQSATTINNDSYEHPTTCEN